MNLMVLRFGHLIAPFKEIFNRKCIITWSSYLHIKKEKKKTPKRKTRKATLQFHIIKEQAKAHKLHHS